jgi:hypothetical protein
VEHQLSCLDSTVHVQLTCYPASPQRANAPTFDSTALGTCPAHPPVLQRLERHPLLGNPAPNVNDVQSTEPAGRRAGSQHQQAWQQRPGAPTQQSRIPAPPCPALPRPGGAGATSPQGSSTHLGRTRHSRLPSACSALQACSLQLLAWDLHSIGCALQLCPAAAPITQHTLPRGPGCPGASAAAHLPALQRHRRCHELLPLETPGGQPPQLFTAGGGGGGGGARGEQQHGPG